MHRPPVSMFDVPLTAWTPSWRNPLRWIFGIFATGGAPDPVPIDPGV